MFDEKDITTIISPILNSLQNNKVVCCRVPLKSYVQIYSILSYKYNCTVNVHRKNWEPLFQRKGIFLRKIQSGIKYLPNSDGTIFIEVQA